MVRFRLRIHLNEYELSAGEVRIGRGIQSTLTIDDPLLSREHAVLRVEEGRATIRDLGSRNGTFVNDVRLGADGPSEVELHHGDRIRIGHTHMLFTRVITPRRDIATTAGIRSCARCTRAYVVQAPSCPHCGAPANEGGEPKRSESQQRRDFWLSLEVELLEKALSMFRLDEADDSVKRLTEKLDALIESGKRVSPEQLEGALTAVTRFARARAATAPLRWVMQTLVRVERLPGPELFSLIAATPPIVLEEAAGPLQTLVNAHVGRASSSPTDASCLRSLVTLLDEVMAFRLQRWEQPAAVAARS